MTTTHTIGTVLGADDLALLSAVLETMLPGDSDMPPASKTDAARAIDGYLTERPTLRAPILDALVAIRIAAHAHGGEFGGLAEAERVATLEAVEASHPHAFDTLLVQAYTGYYVGQYGADMVQKKVSGVYETDSANGAVTVSTFTRPAAPAKLIP